ncbi:hypothetical protein F8O01_09695 [Pseudoclavibacter chungangensis]|uniref:Uncharacterized protein n=1 Tax=Pseudoclavibacter chungangensis TaxID=587635 RepID=A0A7J5BQS8_9MICO|nr:hypothetical protein [Pseudoclavibacter chungangensis]KAB1656658.1 hypothetical protein F8O01_09695 [Pseudoclavibacter chungangensis]NYJ67893.1 hypothetical protein [Pseudoclavibacter chungangensis]
MTLIDSLPEPLRRFLSDDGTPEGRSRRPEFRHGTVLPLQWFAVLFNPAQWRVGHWALFGAFLTALADLIAVFYIANLFGLDVKVEMELWILIAGILGFATIMTAIWAIWRRSARRIAVFALVLGFGFGAVPAWLVGNTILQLIVHGGTLPPSAPAW